MNEHHETWELGIETTPCFDVTDVQIYVQITCFFSPPKQQSTNLVISCNFKPPWLIFCSALPNFMWGQWDPSTFRVQSDLWTNIGFQESMAATTTPLASENWGWTPDFESGDRNRGDGFRPLSERGLSGYPINGSTHDGSSPLIWSVVSNMAQAGLFSISYIYIYNIYIYIWIIWVVILPIDFHIFQDV